MVFEHVFDGQLHGQGFRPFREGLPREKALFQPEIHIVVVAPAVVAGMENNGPRLEKRGQGEDLFETAKGDFPDFFIHGPGIQIHERPVKGDGKVLPAEFPGGFPDFRPAQMVQRQAVKVDFGLQTEIQDPLQILD